MRNTKAVFLAIFLIIFISTSVSMAAVAFDVTVGKETILKLKTSSSRVSVANPEIVGLTLISPSEILLNGKKTGTTSLIVWDKEGKTSFFDVRVMGDRSLLEKQIKEFSPKDEITAEFIKDTVVLSGNAKNQQTINRAVEIAQAYAPKVINHVMIEEAQQVLLEVRVAQIDKTKLKELGIGFMAKGIGSDNAELFAPGSLPAPSGNVGGPAGLNVSPGIASFNLEDVPAQIGVAHFPSGVAAVLKALQTKGYAKLLAEPNLAVRSGEKGEFNVTRRIPVQQVTGIGADRTFTVIFEEVGIKLNFAPEVLETGVIRLKIDPAEVSNIVELRQLDAGFAPIIDKRSVKTGVDLKEGESLVLAGLLTDEMKKNIQKVPILGDIPILGLLFRSTRDELSESELAFFITPKLVRPIPPGVKTELPGDKPLTPQEEREFKWVPLPERSE